ncbi:nuclear transport factor 2 family protein [Phenylobacterium sp.]|uniref:nuclear transport factor 2 family protein n=1 Tax=Phenylobacterium sp. TaxID=1871053 RepID=UPI002FC87144
MNLARSACRMACAAALLAATAAHAHPTAHGAPAALAAPQAPAEAAKVIDAFHAALRQGDTAAAAALLTDAVLIFEAGGAERSKAEYASAHLPGDAVFAQAVGSELTRRTGGTSGDLAWAASEGRTRGRYKDRDVDRITTETMVLRRQAGAWRIVHVHWSSRAASTAH